MQLSSLGVIHSLVDNLSDKRVVTSEINVGVCVFNNFDELNLLKILDELYKLLDFKQFLEWLDLF